MSLLKVTLGANAIPEEITYPVLASYKVDGVRGSIQNGGLVSRTLKPFPNKVIQGFDLESFEGLDGELTVGCPNDATTFNRSTSAIMSHHGNLDGLTLHVFDRIPNSCEKDLDYGLRCARILEDSSYWKGFDTAHKLNVKVIKQVLLNNSEEVYAYECEALDAGYEGVVLRYPDKLYKHGRSTDKSGHLLRLKNFVDAEAEIIGFEELYRNHNEQTTSLTGASVRSSKQEGKVPASMLGSLHVKDCVTGIEFKIGSGFDEKEREVIWDNRDDYLGKIWKYKHFPKGAKVKPRFPISIGERHIQDM